MFKNTYKRIENLITILTILMGTSIMLSVEVCAPRDPINNMEFSNGMKLKTLFIHIRNQAISYMEESLYVTADIRGEDNYQ